MQSKTKIFFKVIIVTLIAFTFAKCLVMIPLDFGFFSSNKSGKTNQFDIYSDLIKRSDNITYDDSIVIVSLPEKAGRAELAETMNMLADCNPAAIAMDIHLDGEKDAAIDSLLIASIKKNKNVIIPSFPDKNPDSLKFLIHPGNANIKHGIVNLDNQGEENGIIRTFLPYYLNGQDTLYCIALEAIKFLYPEKIEKLKQRGNDHEYINYMKEFSCYNYTEIPHFADEIAGKIVILGAETADDVHYTPIDSKLSGLKIHAYAASTVMMEDYINRPPTWLINVITFIILGLFSYLQVLYSIRAGKFAGFLVRLSTYLFFFIFLVLGFIIFHEYSLYIETVWCLLGVIFSPWAQDIYILLEAFISKINNRINQNTNNINI